MAGGLQAKAAARQGRPVVRSIGAAGGGRQDALTTELKEIGELLRRLTAAPWRGERRVLWRGGAAGRARLSAELRPDAEGWCYDERGALRWGGADLETRQSYRFALSADRLVLLDRAGAEMTPLIASPPRAGSAALTLVGVHHCGPDVYETRLIAPAAGQGRWIWRWRVRGPAKDYVSTTLYWPSSGGGAG